MKSVHVDLLVNQIVAGQLDKLVQTGHYGRDREEAAERLICRGIEQALKDGIIKVKKIKL